MAERLLVGSALGCHIRVRADPRVEPQHCEITSVDYADGPRWYVRDLGTRAGTTYLMTACEPEEPGQVIVGTTPRRILPGDTIVIGWTKIVWPGRALGAYPSSKDAPEFVLRPPMGWMNRVDELLVHHGVVDHHNSYLGEALANLLRSWWDGVDAGTDGKSPEWWGPRTREEAAAVNASNPPAPASPAEAPGRCCEFHDRGPGVTPLCGPDDLGGYCCDNCPTLAANTRAARPSEPTTEGEQ